MCERLRACIFNGDEVIGIERDAKRGFETAGPAIENKFLKFSGVVGGDGRADEVGAGGACGEIMAAGGILGQLIGSKQCCVSDLGENVQAAPDGAAFRLDELDGSVSDFVGWVKRGDLRIPFSDESFGKGD